MRKENVYHSKIRNHSFIIISKRSCSIYIDKKLEIEKLTIQELLIKHILLQQLLFGLLKKLGYEGYEAFKKRFLRRTKIYINTF